MLSMLSPTRAAQSSRPRFEKNVEWRGASTRPQHGHANHNSSASGQAILGGRELGARIFNVLEGVVDHDRVEGPLQILGASAEQPERAGLPVSPNRIEGGIRVDAREIQESKIAQAYQKAPAAATNV